MRGEPGTVPLGRADLHIHTSFSDGRDGPEAVVAAAARAHLDVIAVTDHDTMEGSWLAAVAAAEREDGPAVIPALEVTTAHGHVVGLYLREPVAAGMSPAETVRAIRAQGGLAVAVHPFWRPADSERGGGVGPAILAEVFFDATETLNGGPVPSMWRANRRARRAPVGALMGGSDAHAASAVGWAHTLFQGSGPDDLRAAIEARSTRPARRRPNLVALARYGFWGVTSDRRLMRDVLPF
ncbi:MAG: CehA/McbA family metallohydrolase [Candidatus Dormibacterales bacterium]